MVALIKYLHLNGPFLITSQKLLTDKLNMYFYFMVLVKGEAALYLCGPHYLFLITQDQRKTESPSEHLNLTGPG